ncbi:CheY chemotaxis protein or a CheY-like REC (receiver) domain [Sulfitobacter brevis]|uniref:CheY chemotaxis protein or a CheY-like REC (Receiver) domain n=1 Tax=Sulfitobacter brevis TaxID=74348 RepID=A0A1I1YN10_9RHOB|nr:response regulator [Sulfitobacter brevis]SFE20911.1 CheY chemotaxis protein or a CheY-like REC (receiver) domain [Sulfitobacter brevis]
MDNPRPLLGCLVLIVEDEPIISLDVAMTLETAGAEVLGPCYSAKSALDALDAVVKGRALHGAVIDVNLGGHTSEAVAKKLKKLSVPFVFHTGNIPVNGQVINGIDAPIVRKPSYPDELLQCVVGCVCQRS